MKIFKVLSHQGENKTLWALSFICFLWSTSSCMVFSILPTFITEELKLSTIYLGWIEGIAIALAFVAKILSGILSDYFKQRKILLLLGTFFSFLFKILFALATNGWWIFFARSLDRFAKGIRSSPVDALIADISPKSKLGISYGIRQSFYTLGAVFGSFLASKLLLTSGYNYRFVFWLSLIPVALSFIFIIFFVNDIASIQEKNSKQRMKWKWYDLKRLPTKFWQLICVSSILMLARFSDSFLALKSREVGITIVTIPLLMMIYEIIYASVSIPTGFFADKYNRQKILLLGIFILVLANIMMIYSSTPMGIIISYTLFGLHMGVTHSLLSTLIAEHTLSDLRGTAFSIYYLTTGISLFIANPLAGYVSCIFKTASAPFFNGLLFSFISFSLLAIFMFHKKKTSQP